MEDKKKIQAAAIILVIVPMFLTVLLVSISVHRKGREDVQVFREQMVDNARTELKSYVEMAFTLVDSNYRNAGSEEYLEKYYGPVLKNIADATQGQLEYYADQVAKEKMKPEEAKEKAAEVIRRMNFDGGEGSVWISDVTPPAPRMIVSPGDPGMNDALVEDPELEKVMGSNRGLFKVLGDVTKGQPDAFINYVGKTPEDGESNKAGAGISYVRLFPEWNWVIGTSIYLDDALAMAMEKSLMDLRGIRYDNGVGYFWITDMGEPVPRVVMQPVTRDMEGRVMNFEKFNRAFESNMNVFEAYRMTAVQNGSGFVDFRWDKPTEEGVIKDVPKLAYVKLFEPFGWVIGADIYLDDINRDVRTKEAIVIRQVNNLVVKMVIMACVLSVFAIIIANFMINRYIEPAFIRARQNSAGPVAGDSLSDDTQQPQPDEAETASTVIQRAEQALSAPAAAPSGPPEGWEKLIADTVVQISRTVLEEQTKLMAYNAKLDDNESSHKNEMFNKISAELSGLSDEIQRNSEAIDELAQNSKKGSRPRRRL